MTSEYDKMILYVTKLPSTVLIHPVHNIIALKLAFFNKYMNFYHPPAPAVS